METASQYLKTEQSYLLIQTVRKDMPTALAASSSNGLSSIISSEIAK